MYICGARERGRVWEGGEGGEGESGRGRQGEKRGEEEKGVRRRESNNGEGRERRGKEIWDTVCRVRQRERECRQDSRFTCTMYQLTGAM